MLLSCLELLTSEVIEVQLDEAGERAVRLKVITDSQV